MVERGAGDVHRLTRREARRVALTAQLLTAERPTDVLDAVRRLSLLLLEPTAAIAPSADLVLWSRLGSSYSPQDLRDAIDEQHLVDLRGVVRPMEHVAVYLPEMKAFPGVDPPAWRRQQQEWVEVNNDCRLEILETLRADGPLPAKELPDTCVQPWKSSGWNDNRNRRMMLDLLVQRGEVTVAGWRGRDKLWDLAERVYPDGPELSVDEALRVRSERRLRSLGIARPRPPASMLEALDLSDVGEPAVVEGVRGDWRVDPSLLGQPFEGRTALLSPFDWLLHDRKRAQELFETDYILEMYKPADQRRWGYYALPVLYGDQLVGKLDAKADRDAGVLRVHALHEDVPFTAKMRTAVEAEIDDLAQWLRLAVMWS